MHVDSWLREISGHDRSHDLFEGTPFIGAKTYAKVPLDVPLRKEVHFAAQQFFVNRRKDSCAASQLPPDERIDSSLEQRVGVVMI